VDSFGGEDFGLCQGGSRSETPLRSSQEAKAQSVCENMGAVQCRREFPRAACVSAYHFRQFIRADLSLAQRWLQTPEVIRWWGDPKEQLALLTEDLDEPLMRQWIVTHQDSPFAYAQAYEAHAWPQDHLKHLPHGTQVMDVFIGEPTMLGRGHGSAFLRKLAELLVDEGAPMVALDPVVTNLRARRAFTRAGFANQGIVRAKEGLVALMGFPQ
jgi:aminoglycoside 6'-N-acetyltransferase